MTAITRLGEAGYGVRLAGSFLNKTHTNEPGVANVAWTRLGEAGYGVRRYGSFGGKTQSTAAPAAQRNHMFFVDVGNLM